MAGAAVILGGGVGTEEHLERKHLYFFSVLQPLSVLDKLRGFPPRGMCVCVQCPETPEGTN